MRSVPLVLLVGAVLALVLAAGAAAAPPGSAQRFADAAQRAREAFAVAKPQIAAQFRAQDLRTCDRVLDDPKHDPPRRAFDDVWLLYSAAMYNGAIGPAGQPIFERFIADLAAIPTNDPILRGGRDAWRIAVEQYRIPPAVTGACAKLAAWADAGYARGAAPEADLAVMRAVAKGYGRHQERAIDRAERRLRQLGVSRKAAARWAGDDILIPGLPQERVEHFAVDEDEPPGR